MKRPVWLAVAAIVVLSSCSAGSSTSSSPAPPPPSGIATLQLAGLELTPSFSPEQLDYTTRCEGSPPAAVTAVAQTATDQVTLSLASPVAFSSMTRLDVVVSRQGVPLSEYSVRCLPSDFPSVSVERASISKNWLLTSLVAAGGKNTFSVLLDPAGVPVWFTRNPGSHQPTLQPTVAGRFLRTVIPDNDLAAFSVISGSEITEEDFAGNVLRTWQTPSELFVDHHDAVALPNGNLLVTSYVVDTKVSLTGAPIAIAPPGISQPGCTTGPPDKGDKPVISRLLEINPNGEVVSEIRLNDIIANSAINFPLRVNMEVDPAKPARCGYDMFHMNAIDAVGTDKALISALALDGVLMVDRTTRKLLWRLGGADQPESLKILGDPMGDPKRVHDGRMVSADEVMLFDNRMLFPDDPARAVLYKIDEKARTATFVKQWTTSCSMTPCNSSWGGSARVSADGTVFVNTGGRKNGPSVEVFLQDGASVARYNFGIAYRSFPLEDVGFSRSQLRAATDKSGSVTAATSGGCVVEYFGSCTQ